MWLLVYAGIRLRSIHISEMLSYITAGKSRDIFIKEMSKYLKKHITIPFQGLQIDLRVSSQDFNTINSRYIAVVYDTTVQTAQQLQW